MNTTARGIGIEFISVFGLPPVEFAALAARLGCRHIGLALAPMAGNPHDYPLWSLRDDAALRRETVAALRDSGVSISLGEGFLVMPQSDVAKTAADLDLMRELGAPLVNILCLEPDRNRGLDQCAAFAELAAARDLAATLEFVPGLPIGDLPTALAAIRHVGRPNFRLLIDPMHVFRSGATVSDVAAIDPALIGYIQLCDVPIVSRYANYADEARYERLPPGLGELPLAALLAALPRALAVGLEVPMRGQAAAGIGPDERLAGAVEATRALLAHLDA
jgi:sugar phosphate isomerase/epimerase